MRRRFIYNWRWCKILATKDGDHNADTSELEKQIDMLVYKLYGLSAEEIEIIENNAKA